MPSRAEPFALIGCAVEASCGYRAESSRPTAQRFALPERAKHAAGVMDVTPGRGLFSGDAGSPLLTTSPSGAPRRRRDRWRTTVNKADLVKELEKKLGSRKAANDALEAVLDTIVREVAKGG
jgi:hypothetical protein